MSGDVQPRKRKDKRRRKDELSVEEPRGTAAVLGDGDVFIHSHHDHGTGGHWCAKVIFFSLLAVLITLIGLIILENRGLSELEANAVESRYSGVLEGWIEDAPDDDHHDEHTLELKHHDEEDDEHDDLADDDHDDHDDEEEDDDDDDEAHENEDELDEDHDDEDDGDENENDDENETQEDEDDDEERDQDDADEDQNLDSAENEEDENEKNYRKYYEGTEAQQDGDDDNDDDDDKDDDDDNDSNEGLDNDQNDNDNDDQEQDDNSEDNDLRSDEDNNEDENDQQFDHDDNEDDDDNDDDDDDDNDDQKDDESNEYEETQTTHAKEEEGDEDHEEEDTEVEVERIEREVSDEEVLQEAATSAAEEDDKSGEQSDEAPEQDESVEEEEDQTVDEEEFLEPEDIEEPVIVERITAPPGKPLREVEEETSTEKLPDTLADEEEYERQQEELRRQQEQASHLWLKLAVGGALLVATHAVVRRATAPRDASSSEEHASREDTPSAIDRRMTLIPEEPLIVTDEPEEISPPTVMKHVQSIPLPSEKSVEEEDEEEIEIETKNVETAEPDDDEDKELYSDEDDVEEEMEQEEVEDKKEIPKHSALEVKAPPKEIKEAPKEPEHDEDVPEDVEIIDEEQLEEEIVEEEDEDEEEISDVDDAELLSRLEAKYGRLPEPERPGPKKDGGNSIEDEWPGEPSEQYWREQLDEAERELQQGAWDAAAARAGAGAVRGSARARYIVARALDAAAEARRDNRLLSQAITAYLELLKMNERLSDKKLLEITNRTLDRIRFRGNYMNAEPIYRLLIRRFPDDPSHRNNLSIAFLMANRPDLAEQVLKETLLRWPDDRVALAHLGFVLKTSHNKLEEAVDAMRKALEGDIGAANEPRFYFHLGDALLMLGRFDEALEVHKRGAALGHFLSPAQRSLYNVERLKSQPWWNIEQTPYKKLAQALEASWKSILKEGEAARALYEKEKEGLKERGEWSQLDLFVRGQELPGRCKKAPVTCSIVRQEIAAAGCKRGQIKFSSMEAGTHVRPHVGPTNCRLRMHLGLSNTKDTYIRVDKETRQWQTGKVLMFDDSFEHEVWHNGTGARLVLIVDVWHPDLTPQERRQLPAI